MMSATGHKTRLGRYVLSDFIGAGPTGRVHKAQIDGTGRVFALKEFHRHYCQDPAIASQLAAAARQYGALEHPFVATLHGFVASEESIVAAVEYVDGISLDLLLQGERLPMGAGAKLIVQLGRGVGYAHGRGLSHLGISPSNLICTRSGGLMISDFGFLASALMYGHAPNPPLGHRLGYLAPEQLEGKRTSPASDVYSIGVVAYEMLVGHMPYGVLEGDELREAMLHAPIAEPDLGKPYQKFLRRALARSPFERFPDAAAMADAMEAAIRSHPIAGSLSDIGAIVTARLAGADNETTKLYDEGAEGIANSFGDMPTREIAALNEPEFAPATSNAELLLGPAGANKRARREFEGISVALAPYGAEVEEQKIELEGAHLVDVQDSGGPSELRFGDTENEVAVLGREQEGFAEALPEPVTDVVPVSATIREGLSQKTLQGTLPSDLDIGTLPRKKSPTSIPAIPPIPALAPIPAISALAPVAVISGTAPGSALGVPGDASRKATKTAPPPTPPDAARHTRKTTPPPMPISPLTGKPLASPPSAVPTLLGQLPPSIASSTMPEAAPVSAPVSAPDLGIGGLIQTTPAPEFSSGYTMRQTPQAQENHAAPKQNNSGKTWLWGIALLPALAAGGYFAYQKFIVQAEKTVAVKKTSDGGAEVASATVDAAVGKKTVTTTPAISAGLDAATPIAPVTAATADAAMAVRSDAGGAAPSADAGVDSVAPPMDKDTLEIASTPAGASVYLDGTLVGETPVSLDASMDRHRLALILPGYLLHTGELDGKGNVAIELKEVTPGGGPGGIKVRCHKKNRYYIFVDGNPTGQLCPSERIGVPKGRHMVEIYDPVTDSRKQFKANVTGTRASLRVRVD